MRRCEERKEAGRNDGIPEKFCFNVLFLCQNPAINFPFSQYILRNINTHRLNSKEMDTIEIRRHGDNYKAIFPFNRQINETLKQDGHGWWNPDSKSWLLKPEGLMSFLEKHADICVLSEGTQADLDRIKEKKRLKDEEEEREKEYWLLPAEQRLKGIKPDADYDFKSAPFPHQIEAFNYALKHKKVLIADEPGLGKTAESTYVSDYLRSVGKAKKCLIVCGVNTVKYTWMNEIQKHSDQRKPSSLTAQKQSGLSLSMSGKSPRISTTA